MLVFQGVVNGVKRAIGGFENQQEPGPNAGRIRAGVEEVVGHFRIREAENTNRGAFETFLLKVVPCQNFLVRYKPEKESDLWPMLLAPNIFPSAIYLNRGRIL